MNFGQEPPNVADGCEQANESGDLHEDTIDAWKIQKTSTDRRMVGARNASCIQGESPDFTEGDVEGGTQVDRQS